MREGGSSTAVQNNAGGFKISNFWKKPAITNAHNEGSTTNVIFTENNEQIQNTRIYPGAGFSFYSPNNKYTNVQASAYNHEYDVYDEATGIISSIGRVGRNFQENGTTRFTSEMNKTIADMVAARNNYNEQKTEQAALEEQYPEYSFSTSPLGLLYTDQSGKTGLASELAS